MRIRLVFILKNKGALLPFHHQYILWRMLHHILSQSKHFQNYSNYSFSGLKGQTRVSAEGLRFLSSKVTLVLSCDNKDFISFLVETLFKQEEIQIGELGLIPESVEQEEIPKLTDKVKYICISPLVLVNPEYDNFYAKKFIEPSIDIFSDLVYESTISRMEKTGRFTEEQISSFFQFQVIPDKYYLQKIKTEDKKFARIYSSYDEKGDEYELRGYTFPFILYADEEVQQFVFKCGLGAYTHKGFGTLDLANVNPVKRTVLYEVNREL